MKVVSVKEDVRRVRVPGSPPDIDSDFEALRRDEVKRYLEEKYGKNRVCSIGTYTTLKTKQGIRDLCKIHGVTQGEMNYISKLVEVTSEEVNRAVRSRMDTFLKGALSSAPLRDFWKKYPDLIEDLELLLNSPKSPSVHPCGMVILPDEMVLETSLPLRLAEKDGEKILVSEWEGMDLEYVGYLKEDILGINQLDKFRNILNLIKQGTGEEVDIYNIPLDVPEVYQMFQRGENGDVFHIGSKSLTEYTKLVKPTKFKDLAAILSLYRPGPIESQTHMKYIGLKEGKEKPVYYPYLEQTTKETFGLFVYQEQTIEACRIIADLTLGEADEVRRALGKMDVNYLKPFKIRFIEKALEKQYTQSQAEELWTTLERMAAYQFNKCLSGREKISRVSGGSRKSDWSPTIEEMYRIKHDRDYSKKTNHLSLHELYSSKGYGYSWSLNEKGRLVKNKIKDIRYQGLREVYKITLSNGSSIRCTDNHKFPTEYGEVECSKLKVGDSLYVKGSYISEDTVYRFTKENNPEYHTNRSVYPYELNSKKGVQGFITKDTPSTKFEKYQVKEECEKCGSTKNLEKHHIDGDHGNNEESNLLTLCSSCHKKEHYKMGRRKQGEKGLSTEFCRIVSIENIGEEDVYDVEMEHPYHTFVTGEGIVTSNSHAVAYAMTGYICQYLKWKYPLEYWTTALQFATKPEKVIEYIAEINNSSSGIKVLPPDVNVAQVGFKTDYTTKEIFWSLDSIKHCGEVAVSEIIREREKNGPFYSLEEFYSRVPKNKVNKRVVENLVYGGAFDKIENITYPSQRRLLMERLEGLVKFETKVTDNPDTCEDWWWYLKQKQVLNLGTIDLEPFCELPFTFHSITEILNMYIEKKLRTSTGGVVVQVIEKNSVKGTFGEVFIEDNYQTLCVVVWSRVWDGFRKDIMDSKGKILFVNGDVMYDKFRKTLVLQTLDQSQVQIIG